MRRIVSLSLLTVCMSVGARAQDSTRSSTHTFGGPRIGFSFLPPAVVKEIKDNYPRDNMSPLIAQFGWQTETDVVATKDGGAAVVEGVFLVGGFEQGMFLPSVSVLIGGRTAS